MALAYLNIPREIPGGAATSASFSPASPTDVAFTPSVQSPSASGDLEMMSETQSEDVQALADVHPAPTLQMEGQTYFEMPLRRPDPDSEVPAGLKVYVRAAHGPADRLPVGRKCPARRDNEPCNGVPKPDCKSDTIPMDKPSQATTSEFGGSITYWKQPYKLVTYCNYYRCLNGVLVFDHSEKCVSIGTRAWGFDPVTVGSNLVGALLGYDIKTGYRWDLHDPCTRL